MAERRRWSAAALGEWALAAGLFKLLACLPEGVAYAAGEGAARLLFRLDRRHRAITLENLTAALPELGRGGELEDLTRAVFENLGRTTVDVARAGRVLHTTGPAAFQIDGLERLVEARGRGKGVLLLTAHFGPWELLPLSAALHYEPIHVVARPMDNPWLDDWLTRLRERGGNHVIRKRDALQAILQVLRRGETVGILIDQHVTESEGVVVPFFGRPASTVAGPALLALRSGAAVLPVGITRCGRGRYRVHLRPELSVQRSGDLKADVVENTARFTAAIEAIVRERPDHWFWLHRRWKTERPLDPRLTSPMAAGSAMGEQSAEQTDASETVLPAQASPEGSAVPEGPREAPRRILVRMVNWLGDAVLTLPALEALDRRFPRSEIVVLAKPWVAGLFAGQPAVDRVIEYRPVNGADRRMGRWRQARQLAGEGFDLAVVLPNSLEASLVPWLAGIPRRVGRRTDGRGWLLTDPIPRADGSGGRHQVEGYLDLVRSLGADGAARPRLRTTAEAREAAAQLLAASGVSPRAPLLAINPGSIYGGAKRWPADRFAAVADALAESWGATAVLIGSARERSILEEVARRMRRRSIPLGGATTLPALLGVLARARLLLSNDTGAMHVAAAAGTPVVAVFGPTDVEATGPLGSLCRVVRHPVPCSPCLLRECPIDHRCMKGVSVDDVLNTAKALDAARPGACPPSPQPARLGGAASAPGAAAAFLDRDGTIIEDLGYLGDPEQIRFIPGALDALGALRDAGYRLVLVTNQAGVARDLISEADVQQVNGRLEQLLQDAGIRLDGIYYCPHHPDQGSPEYQKDCDCRKPKPGMVHRAVRELGLDPSRAVVIGDHLSDVALARHFPGMRAILLLTGHGRGQLSKIEQGEAPVPDHIAADLWAGVQWLLSHAEREDVLPSHPA